MNTLNFILHGKGGIGKYLINSIIARHFQEMDDNACLMENEAIEAHLSTKKTVVHVVITEGKSMIDALNCFNYLVTKFSSEVEIVIWRKEYFGPVRLEGKVWSTCRK